MPTHGPDLSRLSVSSLAELTGYDRRTIRLRLKREPAIQPVERDGRTVWYPAREALERIYLGESLDLTRERARLAREQADAQELKNRQARGELVPGDQIESAWVALMSGVRSRLLSVPSKVAPIVHAAKTPAEAEAIIREHQTEALAELSGALG